MYGVLSHRFFANLVRETLHRKYGRSTSIVFKISFVDSIRNGQFGKLPISRKNAQVTNQYVPLLEICCGLSHV